MKIIIRSAFIALCLVLIASCQNGATNDAGLIKEAVPQGGKIMIFVGKLDARNAQERLQGIREILKDSNIQVIDVRTDDTDRVRAKANASDTLVLHSDIAALVSCG